MRLDKYLKVSRIIKRRTVANEACDSGRVMLNDKIARASAEVKVGDVIEIGFGNKSVKVKVTSVQETVRKEEALRQECCRAFCVFRIINHNYADTSLSACFLRPPFQRSKHFSFWE